MSIDTEDPTRSYKLPSIVGQNVPRLEERNESTIIDSRLTTQPLNQQNPEQVVSFIKNLERFCNDIAENKLFWTPEVISFFGIKDETLKREYEFAREEIQRQL